MNRDRIERALREPGPRERGYSPEALPATAAELRARVPRRNRLLMSAGAFGGFAAAVAAGAVIAVVLSRGVAPGPGTGGTVLSPTPTAVPTSTPTLLPTPTASPAPIAACRAGDFAWSSDAWGGAMGSRWTTILARGVTSLQPCVIRGEAILTLRDANGTLLLSAHAAATDVSVSAGKLFQMGVSWSNWCGNDPAQPISLTLVLPGDTLPVPVIPASGSIQVPPCNGAAQSSSLSGTGFQPSDRPPPEG
jgi:hypothetical protein